jgi:CheY-like chemotaxis protein
MTTAPHFYLHCAPQALFDAVGADVASFDTVARLYLDSAAATGARWQALAGGADVKALAALCHELRGTALLLGAVTLGAQLAGCEAAARAGHMPAPAALAAVARELGLIAEEMALAWVRLCSAGAAAPQTPPNVLVVDDDALNRELLSLQLRKSGCTVTQAPDGAAALAALGQQPYALVFMDLQMPVLDGYAASAAWRRLEAAQARRVCILGLSADGDDSGAAWRAAGMDAMLVKPLHPSTISALLAHWLGWRGLA